MSACENLQRMFENPPLPENPTLLETLSKNQIKHVKSIDSFATLFGDSPSPSPSPSLSLSSSSPHLCSETYHTTLTLTREHSNQHVSNTAPTPPHRNGDGLHRCTEGLGFESSDEVEEWKKGEWWESVREKEGLGLEDCCDGEWRRRWWREYPPPISCIGRSGKPFVRFLSYRDNGRFVLKQVWSPNQHFLHAHREDGRLKLHFLLPQEEEGEENDNDNDEEEEENDNDNDEDDKYKEEEEDYYDTENVDDEGEEHMGREKDEV